MGIPYRPLSDNDFEHVIAGEEKPYLAEEGTYPGSLMTWHSVSYPRFGEKFFFPGSVFVPCTA